MAETDSACSVWMRPIAELTGELRLRLTHVNGWRVDYIDPLEETGTLGASIAGTVEVIGGPVVLNGKSFAVYFSRFSTSQRRRKTTNCVALGSHTCSISLQLEDGDFAFITALFAAGMLDDDVVIEFPFFPEVKKYGGRRGPVTEMLKAEITQFSIQRHGPGELRPAAPHGSSRPLNRGDDGGNGGDDASGSRD